MVFVINDDDDDKDNVEREVGEPFPGSYLRYRMGRRGQSVSVTTSNTAFLNNALGKIFTKKRGMHVKELISKKHC